MGFVSDFDVILLPRKVAHNSCPLTDTGYHFQVTAQLFDAGLQILQSMTMPLECCSIESHSIILHDQTNPSFVQLKRESTRMCAGVTQTITHGLSSNG